MLIVLGLYDIDIVDVNGLWEINVLFILCIFILYVIVNLYFVYLLKLF